MVCHKTDFRDYCFDSTGMDSENLYDAFKDEIWKELGPLDPDWFETLSAETISNEGHVSDQEDLCANQEGHFKTPLDKTAVDSRFFSTPKAFRHSRVVSPETEDERSFTAEQEKETSLWTTTQSPLFQMSKEGIPLTKNGGIQPQSPGGFDLLHSPQKSSVSYAQHISESLGAQIHPDISWTSSLNTPPALPSTLILTKPDESPHQVNVSADKNFILVRELFPSLPTSSRGGVVSPRNDNIAAAHQAVGVSPEPDQNPQPHDSPQSSLNQSGGLWRQKLPECIEDGDVRSTVASVLDGAENVLSIFFTNSSSALRKVKTDRIKRQQVFPKTESGCSSSDISTTKTAESSGQRAADQESGRHPLTPPVMNGDVEITQWSPLSSSEIPLCTVDTSCRDSRPATQELERDSHSDKPIRLPLKITDSGFTKKKRNFVYTVKTLKPQPQGKETAPQKMDSSSGIPDFGQEVNVSQLEKASDEANLCSVEEKEMQKKGNLEAKVLGLDMSQLCRDFAQDFSQMSDPTKLSKVAEETPQNGFSPSACLLVLKQARQKERQAALSPDCDGVHGRRLLSTTNENNFVSGVTVGDSGYQSAVADVSHMTASSFVVSNSENNRQSQQWTDFKTDTHRTQHFSSTNKGNTKVHLNDVLQEDETGVELCSAATGETLGPRRKTESHPESTSAQLPSSGNTTGAPINCTLREKTTDSLPSVHASGFKTASNRAIKISSANLERAKRLFEETEGERTFHGQPTNCVQDAEAETIVPHGSVKNTPSNSNQPPSTDEKYVDLSCQLTASQKVDVTELCTLLEEADSQFEFTQFKTSKPKQQDKTASPQKVDKELDPDFLSGIDFDDSFSSGAEKALAVPVIHDKMTSVSPCKTNGVAGKPTGLPLSCAVKKENLSAEDASSSSKHFSDSSNGILSAEPRNLDRAARSETITPENKSSLMLGVGFKTAGGNVVRVSENGLSKARALFSDLEETRVTSQKSPDKNSRETGAEMQHGHSLDDFTANNLHRKEDHMKFTSNGGDTTGRIQGLRDEEATKSLKNSKMDSATCQSGFQMASGKGVSISAKALQEADAFFRDCNVMDSNTGMSVEQKKGTELLPGAVRQKKNLSKFKNVQSMKVGVSEETVHEFENVKRHTESLHPNMKTHNSGFKSTPVLKKAASASAEKGLSSLSCAASRNIDSSVHELSADSGFSTALGKKVFVSTDAIKKAQYLLNEIHTPEDTNRQTKQNGDPLRTDHLTGRIHQNVKNGGFQTASGKGVVISSAALKKAKSLLNDCVEDEVNTKSTHFKMPAPAPPSRHTGFLAASGKPVAFSSEALQRAKTLFSDISFGAEPPPISDTVNSDRKQDSAEDKKKTHFEDVNTDSHLDEKMHKGVLKNTPLSTNAASLHEDSSLKAKTLSSPSCAASKTLGFSVTSEFSNSGGFCTASGKKVSVSDDALAKAKTLLSDSATFEDTIKRAKQKEDILSPKTGGFQTASGKGVVISSAALKKAKVLFNECGAEDNIGVKPTHFNMSVPGPASRTGGFLAASGKPVTFSSEALQKAKALFSDISVSAEIPAVSNPRNCDKTQVKAENIEKIHHGLSATIEAKVPVSENNQFITKDSLTEFDDGSISTKAMQEADAFFEDYIMDEDEGGSVKHEQTVAPVSGDRRVTNVSEEPGRGCSQFEDGSVLPPQTGGFQTASGKGVVISTAALKKAKTLFTECDGGEDDVIIKPTHPQMSLPDKPSRTGGFLAASGKPVSFSSEALQKAKALFSDISLSAEIPADSNPGNSDKTEINAVNSRDTCKSDLSKLKDVKSTSYRHLTACVKDMPTKKSAPQEEADGFVRKNKTSTNKTNGTEASKVNRAGESSVLYLQSLNLSGCTETQQTFFAQEALDCTKALLEDESLTGQSLSMTSGNVSLRDKPETSNRDAEEQKGTGKRMAEDADLTGQPPLKRRLLEEFDRTVDGPSGSTLLPQKSCPNGDVKDRRVFRYSVSLHPNITRPLKNGNNYVENRLQKTTHDSTPADRRLPHSKTPAFVPPFLKNGQTESHKNTVLKDDRRKPSAFVPPFKKQRTIVQESSSEPQEEHHRHPFVTPFKTNTFVPPTKKTQSTADVTDDNKSKEDTQTVLLVNTANDNLMNNQNLRAAGGSEESAAQTSRVEDAASRSPDVFQNLDNLVLARDMQDMRIRKKKRQTIRPFPGSLFLTRTSGVSRIALKAAVNGKPPARYTQKQLYGHGVHRHVCDISSETAESFRFSLQHFIRKEACIDGGGVQLADGGWLIPSNDGTAGKEEFYRALCDTPGVDPKLISEEWVYNHYRWIVWKQASMERSFPETMGSLCLTPEQVLLQLKYRYDVEVDHSRRPALRKIMEKDDTAAKTLVLCVCGVVSGGHSPKRQSSNDAKTPQGADANADKQSAVVWLTDGWYAIKAQLDEPLTSMLHKSRLAVGGKLIVHGAQLVGSQDACSPLEAPESLMLKICANSSRPTRWDAKLGFHRDPRPFLLPVSSLYSNGGPVGCVDIVILRSYPVQWMERKPGGGVVFRSVRAEEKEARRHNSHRQKAMETLFARIQAEFEKEERGNNKSQRRRRTISRQDISSLQDGEELYEAVAADPAYLEAHLSERQLETLCTYRRSLVEKKQAELQDRYRRALESAEDSEGSCPKRDVTPVWRLCIADSTDEHGRVYQLNLWRPSSDLQSLLKEGVRYKVYNLTATEGKKHGGSPTVQLTGTKKTQFQNLQASQEWLSTRFQPRVSARFVDLQNPEFQPLCGEVDLAGFVISVIDGQGSCPAFYLADGKLDLVKVRCFSSLAQSGLDAVVKPRVLLALSNLQLRGQSTSPTPVVYAGDLTVFSTNPKDVHLRESFCHLRDLIQAQENFFTSAEDKLSLLLRSDGLSSSSPACSTERRQDTKTSVTSVHPARNFGTFTPVSRKLPAGNCSTEKNPGSLKRKRALDYLSRIPSPPPLSNLSFTATPRVNKTFNPPRRSGTPSTLKTVPAPAHKPVDSPADDGWVNDEELAMIDTQALLAGDAL